MLTKDEAVSKQARLMPEIADTLHDAGVCPKVIEKIMMLCHELETTAMMVTARSITGDKKI